MLQEGTEQEDKDKEHKKKKKSKHKKEKKHKKKHKKDKKKKRSSKEGEEFEDVKSDDQNLKKESGEEDEGIIQTSNKSIKKREQKRQDKMSKAA